MVTGGHVTRVYQQGKGRGLWCLQRLNTAYFSPSCPHVGQTDRDAGEPGVKLTGIAPKVATGVEAGESGVKQTESAPEVVAGVDGVEQTESVPEVTAGVGGVEQAESAPEVAAAVDAEEPAVEQTDGDGWHVVGGNGFKVGVHKDEVRTVLL